jgi:hypothetical protein
MLPSSSTPGETHCRLNWAGAFTLCARKTVAAFSHQIRLAATERKRGANHDNVSVWWATQPSLERICLRWNFIGVSPITCAGAELNYSKGAKAHFAENGANHDIAWHRRCAIGLPAAADEACSAVRRVVVAPSIAI